MRQCCKTLNITLYTSYQTAAEDESLLRKVKHVTTFIVIVTQRLKTNIKEETLPNYDNGVITRVATQLTYPGSQYSTTLSATAETI